MVFIKGLSRRRVLRKLRRGLELVEELEPNVSRRPLFWRALISDG